MAHQDLENRFIEGYRTNPINAPGGVARPAEPVSRLCSLRFPGPGVVDLRISNSKYPKPLFLFLRVFSLLRINKQAFS